MMGFKFGGFGRFYVNKSKGELKVGRRRDWLWIGVIGLLLWQGAVQPVQGASPDQYKDYDTWPKWAIKSESDDVDTVYGGDLPEAVFWELMIGDAPPNGDFYSQRTFRPQDSITRAEYATLLARALGLETPPANTEVWYGPVVSALTERGVLRNQGDFNQPILRREMGEWVGRALQWYESEVTGAAVSFSDIAGLEEAAYIQLASKAGVIKGYPDGTYGPERTATRTEAAVMAVRVAKQLQKNSPTAEDLKRLVEAKWVIQTQLQKRVVEGHAWSSEGLEAYMSKMYLDGFAGFNAWWRFFYFHRPPNTYREILSVKVRPVLLRDTIAVASVTFDNRLVHLNGEVEREFTSDPDYVYFFKRDGRWLVGHAVPEYFFSQEEQPEVTTP
jgi:hypothetical protein